MEVARRAGDVAQEGAVRRVDLHAGGGILDAHEHFALRADGDVAVHVAELRAPGRQLEPVADGRVAGKRRDSAYESGAGEGDAGGKWFSHGGAANYVRSA